MCLIVGTNLFYINWICDGGEKRRRHLLTIRWTVHLVRLFSYAYSNYLLGIEENAMLRGILTKSLTDRSFDTDEVLTQTHFKVIFCS